ncbi:HAMP domain-containing protein [Spirulina major CS-329]|uniref:HAMP domain-containing protein n=1 Tax=Spirulina TaxID=1154 RepID=UPI00232D8FCB|nr:MULTISPECIES: HAMP domain-containing protein [Spirulina]MDB9496397.1 HAMP domain-containing protein [Spirulina subsalsa CS-330]MDB9503560.1 HAMP domain-containing protein [Spirulina major CS-329]
MTAIQSSTTPRFLSLRWKIMVGFTLVFALVFSGSYYWFYRFTTTRAIERLKADLRNTTEGAVKGVDVPELLQLYQVGKRNSTGYSDAPAYQNQMDWFEIVHRLEPRVYPYSFILGDPKTNRRISEIKDEDTDLEIIYLVDSLWKYNPDRALLFLDSDTPSEASRRTFEEGVLTERDLYKDEWGSWISAYAPLKDENGTIIGVLGMDIEADYVYSLQRQIQNSFVIAFVVTYGSLFILIYGVSDILTKPIIALTDVSNAIGEGHYDQDLKQFSRARFPDEIGRLAVVFELMVSKVRKREEKLKEQVAELKIEIDEVKRNKQVKEIVDSDFFQDLQKKAQEIRSRRRSSAAQAADPDPQAPESDASDSPESPSN